MPLDCGSTKPNTICTAIAASTAEPPACNISRPAFEAKGLALATAVFCVMTSVLRTNPLAISGCKGVLDASDALEAIWAVKGLGSRLEVCQCAHPPKTHPTQIAWHTEEERK